MHEANRKLPIGIQDFEKIRKAFFMWIKRSMFTGWFKAECLIF